MSRILVSTHDLDRAGKLREAFREEGYRVELVTPSEELSAEQEPVLLVLSGGAGTHAAADLVEEAGRLGLPVIGYGPPGAPPSTDQVIDIFQSTNSPAEAALIGKTLVERDRLQEVTGIVGETERMREVMTRIVQIAPVDSTVLVTGESGTGKELVARGIHALSRRKHQPFIAVNVAALPDTLLESELFGHEKGAFTGAVDSRRGFFELADRGTIFLDEIGEMPMATQTKLLRVLEQREFLRVGGERDIKVDVRIVTATNRDLRELVNHKRFRQDLYFRLNVLRIELPPLSERRADIPRLIEAFVEEASEHHDRPRVDISPRAMQILVDYDWPGNVRELRNLVESMVVLAPGREIRPEDIPEEVRDPKASPGRALVRASEARLPVLREREPGDDVARPELEFIFKHLMDLRIDIDDLRREFEAYRRESRPEAPPRVFRLPGGGEVHLPPDARAARTGSTEPADEAAGAMFAGAPPDHHGGGEGREELGGGGNAEHERAGDTAAAPGQELEQGDRLPEGTVVFRPGTTMEEMEREAIAAALRLVEGNRRRAAEMLGIGERTLYRKIKRFGLEDVGS